jgi:hypothetical protein
VKVNTTSQRLRSALIAQYGRNANADRRHEVGQACAFRTS